MQKTRVGASIVEVRTLSHPDPANNNEQTVVSGLEYLHRDHLGSVEAVTDESGAKLLTLAHDPFGARRKADWIRSLDSGEIETLADDLKLKVSRGYSDHEHLDRAGFIHMNGRVHDPRTGRFLSPDPVVENPAFSQSWHSYSHVGNSPLSLVDPTGLSIAPCPIPAADFSCNPIGSPGAFGGTIQTIISNIHRVRFEVFVYDTLVFGSVGGMPGEQEYVFDVLSVIRVFVTVASESVEREVPADDKSEADEPLDAQGTQEGWYRRLLSKRYSKLLAECEEIHGPGKCSETTVAEYIPLFEEATIVLGAAGVNTAVGTTAAARGVTAISVRGPLASKVVNRPPLRVSDQQLGEKFGKHLDENVAGYRTHEEYRRLAEKVYNDPNSKRAVFPKDASTYSGETHYQLGDDLLRLDPEGQFRSLYRLVK